MPVNVGLAIGAYPVILGIVGLFKIAPTPVVAFQSVCTCAAGIVGLLVRSVYLPENPEITPLVILIVVPSTFTPPKIVVVAVGRA